MCNKSFHNIRVIPFDNILSIIPHKCKFEGCEEVVRATDDHEEFCRYRPTACMTCEWKGCVKDIFDHIQNKFEPSEMMCVITNDRSSTFVFEFENPYDRKLKRIFPHLAFGHLFWWKFTNDPESKEFLVTITCVPQDKKNYFFRIGLSIKQKNKTFSDSKLMSLKKCTINEDNFISLPSSLFQLMFDIDNVLSYSVCIQLPCKQNHTHVLDNSFFSIFQPF